MATRKRKLKMLKTLNLLPHKTKIEKFQFLLFFFFLIRAKDKRTRDQEWKKHQDFFLGEKTEIILHFDFLFCMYERTKETKF